jgi:hypothetical protein
MWHSMMQRAGLVAIGLAAALVQADDTEAPPDVAAERMAVMKARVEVITITSADETIPRRMQPSPLFRYDDETRGYIDGTVWRLGESGRPLAIVTAELHPNYLGSGQKIVYDLLCLTERRFMLRSQDIPGWSPQGTAVELHPLPDAPPPAAAPAVRLAQIKQQARRFTATQEVSEIDTQFVHLRLLPREIDRYQPIASDLADGAMFLLVNGRNPALVLVVETDGQRWQWGVGRLTLPSNLEVFLDERSVWKQPRNPPNGWTSPYCATNRPASFP